MGTALGNVIHGYVTEIVSSQNLNTFEVYCLMKADIINVNYDMF